MAPQDYIWSVLKLKAPDDTEDFPGQKPIEQMSLNDVLPDDADFACPCSFKMHQQEVPKREAR